MLKLKHFQLVVSSNSIFDWDHGRKNAPEATPSAIWKHACNYGSYPLPKL
jgi:hypothetical protein